MSEQDSRIFDFLFEGTTCDTMKEKCMQVVSKVPDLQYINPEDFCVIIAKYDSGNLAGMMRYLNKFYRQWMCFLSGTMIPPYALTFYPAFFRVESKQEKARVLIHELKHISEGKVRCTAHTGFGDEDTVALYLQNKDELDELF